MGAAAVAAAAGALDRGQPAAAASRPHGRSGTMADLKHIVIVMQENRSYDHYFGTLGLPGSRGFGDKQVLTWQNGQTNYYDPNSRSEGYLLPYRADTTKYNAQNTSSRMWYFDEQDIPWHHALAKAYTVADHYFCALNTSTDPNRIMYWSGTNDPQGVLGGGPRINNDQNGEFLFKWKTYPEVLEEAGVTWQMYVDNNVDTGWMGDFEDNLLRDFAAYAPGTASADLASRGNIVVPYTTPPAGVANDSSDLDYVLREFISDCAAGTIPQVSYVTSPAAWSEHPNNAPSHGAMYCDRVIQAVHDNPELWDSTLIIINFDEPNGANRIGDGGFFDHVTPPIPEVGTAGERAPGLWPGYGGRIPLTMISPWTRGGWVVSEVFDHTSTIQLLEQWTTFLGKPAICPNISAWRRSISGDMLSAIDFTQFDNSYPTLPSRDSLNAAVTADASLPAVPQPAVGAQALPTQTTNGPLNLRPLPYQAHGVLVEDRATGSVTVNLSYSGGKAGKAVSLIGLADKYLPSLTGAEPLGLGQDGLPMTVNNQKASSYTWDATQTDGKYALSFYGPDHFVRSFAGQLVLPTEHDAKIPLATAELVKGKSGNGSVVFTLSATGTRTVRFELKANDFLGRDTVIEVDGGKKKTFTWPTEAGYYDVIITADTGTGWTQRYAGRVAQA
ncbi:alkaline phosphatase family protein [Gryllotalpicola reticulitermitis]|uniref:Alkaline phosphatase family protein n=1 Tax=Gryllotalpicola reticulitermitis TaxID=1184153 RepID=A0ABV8QA31_9MICO